MVSCTYCGEYHCQGECHQDYDYHGPEPDPYNYVYQILDVYKKGKMTKAEVVEQISFVCDNFEIIKLLEEFKPDETDRKSVV